jgi:hypothetical protein
MNHSRRLLLTSTALALLGIMPATAQQITGTPGAPSATTTIDGNYIPNPPPAFGGEINLNAKDSKTWWPPNIVPPKGAPNILLIMTDDQGYGISGTFGGVIPTPTMDASRKWDCATRSFIRPHSVHPRGRRSSPGVTITPSASGSSPNRLRAIRATTPSSASTTPPSAKF